jgi:hypothetical protein
MRRMLSLDPDRAAVGYVLVLVFGGLVMKYE